MLTGVLMTSDVPSFCFVAEFSGKANALRRSALWVRLIRLLRTRMVCKRRLHRRRPVVSRTGTFLRFTWTIAFIPSTVIGVPKVE
jgi:hypothetical protein